MPTTDTLKSLIKATFNLEGLDPASIDDDAFLFGPEGLGLDSLDAVELVVLVHKHFGVQIRDMQESREIFRSVRTLATYIDAHRPA